MKKIVLSIDGMTCSACSNGLEKYLNKQNGIKEASVNLIMATANIEYDDKILSIDDLEVFVKKAGFKSLGEFKEIKIENKDAKQRNIFIIFTILAIILMYISMGGMLKLPVIKLIDIGTNPINYTICLFIFSIIFLIYGFDILKNGYKNLIHKTPNMDTLVGLGALSSFIYSVYSMSLILNGDYMAVHHLYFESTAMIIYFIKLGRYLDGISKDKTKTAIQKLVTITPQKAIKKDNGVEKEVTIDEIQKSDILICKPGEKIAVDGKVIYGEAHVDESFITGESKPAHKVIGDKVLAGSINYDGFIEYEAEKIGKESMVSEIVKLVVEASNTKPQISKLADKVSSYFVPMVIIIAIFTFIVYLLLGFEFSDSLITFVTVLVVACPCSLGLATPLAVVVSEGKCASSGILIKKSEILEKAEKVDTIVFDKTGTLTYGKLKIADIKNYTDILEEDLIKIIGSVESKSTHPIAKAFSDYMFENKLNKLEVEEFENITGLGIVAKVNGNKIILGNKKIVDYFNVSNPYINDEMELASNGNSIVYVIQNEKIIALIGVSDIVRENVKDIIATFSKKNIKTIMLTGDNEETANKIAKEVGIDNIIANVLPKDKADTVKKLQRENRYVMMCGDGINDSPALAVADIGVSIKSGTDIAMDSSDIILTKNDLGSILELLEISKKTLKIIKQNLFWAFFYNILMLPIAVGILKPFGISINPMIASLAMVFSSITVILNTLRLKK